MEKDDVQLIHRTLSGDEAAFSELVKKHQKSVHALAWRKIGDFHIAEEITQDTFLLAYKRLASLKNPSQFAGWLYVITDRQCKAWFRKKRIDMQSLEATSEKTLEKTAYTDYICEQREDAAVEHRRKIVQKLMEKLPESERTVMVLHYLGEMSCEAISKFLGVSQGTIKSRLKRARERLKNEEHIIRETLGSVPLNQNLTDNIMQRIDTIEQTSPSTGKPLLPLAALGASAILVILLMGASKQFTANFQKPYSVDARSEPTIEIVNAPVVLNHQSKPQLQNRIGGTESSKNRNDGLTEGTEKVENNLTQDAMQWNLPEDAKARLGKGRINEIQYSPDGTVLAVASDIGIWIYDSDTHQEIALLTDHDGEVTDITFSPEGRYFASRSKHNSEEGKILLWDRTSGTQTTLAVDTRVFLNIGLRFSPDGKTLACGIGDTVTLWDSATGEQKSTLTNETIDINNYLSFSPDGETIVCVNWEGIVSLWDPITAKHKKTISEQKMMTLSAALSPDGKTIATGCENGAVYLRDLNTGKLRFTLTGHTWDVDNLVFSPDGEILASASYVDNTICLWDVDTGERKRTLTGHTWDIRGIAFNPDGKTFVSGGADDSIRFWDVHTGNQKHIITGHTGFVASVAFSPDGKLIATGYDSRNIRFSDVNTGQPVKTFDGFKDWIPSIVFTTDGKTLVCGSGENVHILDSQAGEHKMVLTRQTSSKQRSGIHSVALSPDEKTIASGSEDKTICLWDMFTGKQEKILIGHTHRVYRVAFSPDGKILASASDDDTIRIWDAITGEDKMILTQPTGHEEKVEGIMSVTFSPDGKTLASGSRDHIIILWDIDTGKSKMKLFGHKYPVFSLAFSPDGKTLVSGCLDGDIRLWNANTGEQKKTLTGHTGWVRSIAFSPDGKTLVSGSDDGTVLIWEINP